MIRMAIHEDIPALVQLGIGMHRESNFSTVPFDAERVAAMARYLIDNDGGFLVVYERNEVVLGFLAGVLIPAWFGNGRDCSAGDIALYVDPRARHSAAGILLADAFKRWAMASGALQIRVGTAAGEAGQAANAIYQHLGFKYAGQCFVLDLTQTLEQQAAA